MKSGFDADLDELFAGAVRYEVVDAAPGSATGQIVIARDSETDLRALREALLIDSRSNGRCMCGGDASLRLLDAQGRATTLGLHHSTSIRWSERWRYDGVLLEPERLASLFAVQGWPVYRRMLDEREERDADSERARARWIAAMPASLVPFATALMDAMGQPPEAVLQAARAALVADAGSEEGAVRALLGWYGSGAGPWSGFPAYEQAASHLLLSFKTSTIVAALERGMDLPRLDGAARLFAGWNFRRERKKVSAKLVDRLLAHLGTQGDADRTTQLARAFKRHRSDHGGGAQDPA